MSEAQDLAEVLAQIPCPYIYRRTAADMLRTQEAEIAALKAQLQEQALTHLASEGQWIERTGKLEAAKAELLGALERLMQLKMSGPQHDDILCHVYRAQATAAWNAALEAITKHKDTP